VHLAPLEPGASGPQCQLMLALRCDFGNECSRTVANKPNPNQKVPGILFIQKLLVISTEPIEHFIFQRAFSSSRQRRLSALWPASKIVASGFGDLFNALRGGFGSSLRPAKRRTATSNGLQIPLALCIRPWLLRQDLQDPLDLSPLTHS